MAVKRDIGMLEVGEDPEALDLGLLPLDLAKGVLPAFLAEGARRHLLAAHPALLELAFDREAVGVPARDERREVAFHRLAPDDEVLEEAVEHVAAVHVAVGVGRPVVEGVFLRPGPLLHQKLVEGNFFPPLEHRRFLLGEVAPHLERGRAEAQRAFKIHSLLLWA